MTKNRILIVARDADLRASLARWLIGAAYAVELADGPKRARDLAARDTFALAIIAPEGFDADGAALLGELTKQTGKVIVVTGPDSPPEALALRPDHRMAQPLREEDVLVRLAAALAEPGEPVLIFDAFTVNVAARTCTDANGRPIALTRGEFSLLATLARRPDQLVTRDELRRVVAGRAGAKPDDRSLDVLMSRLRRKVELDPKQPRIIVTMPGEGYKFTLKLKEPAKKSPAAAPSSNPTRPEPALPDPQDSNLATTEVRAWPSPQRSSTPAKVALVAAGLAGLAALLTVMSTYWRPAPETPPLAQQRQLFDPDVIPLIADADRRALATYPTLPGFKALAIAAQGWGVASGTSDLESAKREALQRCGVRAKSAICKIYASGMDVTWSRDWVPMALAADLHTEPLEEPLRAADLPLSASRRARVEQFTSQADHKALAFTGRSYFVHAGSADQAEAVRLVLERCGEHYQAPCMVASVDGMLTVRIPKSHRVTGTFLLTTATEMTNEEKLRIADIYRQKDWRALVRGKSGNWYAVANAPSEEAAVDAALQSCASTDAQCRLHAIGNFRVAGSGEEPVP